MRACCSGVSGTWIDWRGSLMFPSRRGVRGPIPCARDVARGCGNVVGPKCSGKDALRPVNGLLRDRVRQRWTRAVCNPFSHSENGGAMSLAVGFFADPFPQEFGDSFGDSVDLAAQHRATIPGQPCFSHSARPRTA